MNYIKFEAFEEVKMKARSVVRGFQEKVDPQRDSPTVAKESRKLMLAVGANDEIFTTACLDATNTFLQGREITH